MIWLGMFVLIVVVVVGGLGLRGWQSQTPPALGLIHGSLQPCSDKPNCVCSEAAASDSIHAIAPLGDAGWQAVRQAVQLSGGVITSDDGHYLHATFTSSVFHFVDDVEVRRDAVNRRFHIRSASRAGHSDFGVNRKRVEAIRARL